ncbi:hypothetical protein IFO70_18935 [Phormidium tenue FACHB-886]|nr:hypothetical protein [Phormidium tenue FACHB-886]
MYGIRLRASPGRDAAKAAGVASQYHTYPDRFVKGLPLPPAVPTRLGQLLLQHRGLV